MNIHKKKMYKFLFMKNIFKYLRIICMIGFLVFLCLLINEMLFQPYRTQKAQNRTYELYKGFDTADYETAVLRSTKAPSSVTSVPLPDRDEKGRLLQFTTLLKENEEVKGWLTIPDTNINYVVMQPCSEKPDYYLSKNMFKEYDKAGCLFIDADSSLEEQPKNIVIHGHNMSSTKNMFHQLVNYKSLNYYNKRPVFTFDTIYETGQWKIISVFITNGTSENENLFDYTKSVFRNDSEFLNFIYQLKIRSILDINSVDINEKDRIVILSTCSYELKNYRTVVVARKVRVGEDANVNVSNITANPSPLYPSSWYAKYGGKAPLLSQTFEKALESNQIKWYKSLE
jgi:sortase B